MEDGTRRPKKKLKIRNKQTDYYSSSEDDEGVEVQDVQEPIELTASNATPIRTKPKPILKQDVVAAPVELDEALDEDEPDLDELERNTALNAGGAESDEEEDSDDEAVENSSNSDPDSSADDDSDLDSTTKPARQKKKRNDPTAFATSISKILSTKLPTSKRPDPVLVRSSEAHSTSQNLAFAKLTQKTHSLLRKEKLLAQQNGRETDVLGLETPEVDTGMRLEEEERLKKTAQRGVVRLFNAVRAAQVRAEEGARTVQSDLGVIGRERRREKVEEMSKEGFLDLISKGGGTKRAVEA